jgi:hypothetical protein
MKTSNEESCKKKIIKSEVAPDVAADITAQTEGLRILQPSTPLFLTLSADSEGELPSTMLLI